MDAAATLAALPRPVARTCLAVRRFLEHDLKLNLRGSRLLLAVSGGADSLALLCLLRLLRPYLGCTLRVLHLDHQLRPESLREARAVAQQCTAWQIPCVIQRRDVNAYAARHGLGLEDAGRRLRYALLEVERGNSGCAWIVTGHHRSDLEEDVLLRLIRGAGWPGLGGMAALHEERHILRPLLLTDPERLRELLRACGVHWAEDPSNQELRWRRNRLRHRILPLLHAENPSLHRSVETLWQLAGEDAAHWKTVLDGALAAFPLEKLETGIALPAALLRYLDKAGRLRLYMRVLERLREKSGQGQARAETLFQLDSAWTEGRGGTCFQFPGGVSATVRHGRICFSLR